MKSNEIEKLFFSDIRNKKRIGSGAYHRTGKGIKHRMSGIKFPSDYLTKKELKALSGKVVVYNMYDKILTKDEFKKLDLEIQKNMLSYWREKYTIKEIQEQMGIAGATLYRFIETLGLPKNHRSKRKKQGNSEVSTAMAISPEPVKLIKKGLYLEYNGAYSGEQIAKMFERLQILLEDEEKEFNVIVSVEEKF